MRFGYFMMPMHAPGSPISQTLQTDLAQIELLDVLGFDEAWIGEHFTAEWENIPAPDIFIGAALQRTRSIKLGTGVTCLPNHNPFHLAHRIAMLDQLAQGRFMWGIGSGGFPGDFEAQSGQGAISLHSEEHLVTSDRGVMLQRRILEKQIEVVAAGGDPLGVNFDPSKAVHAVRSGNFFRAARAAAG